MYNHFIIHFFTKTMHLLSLIHLSHGSTLLRWPQNQQRNKTYLTKFVEVVFLKNKIVLEVVFNS